MNLRCVVCRIRRLRGRAALLQGQTNLVVSLVRVSRLRGAIGDAAGTGTKLAGIADRIPGLK
jgi:hypothetical protein